MVIPGNGYCFISSLLITLAEAGINKTMEVLSVEVMNDIIKHIHHYRQFDSELLTSSDEQFLEACSNYFQRGLHSNEIVDVCIGAVANTVGVNLNLFQKAGRMVTLLKYDCSQYPSGVNLFLHYLLGSKNVKSLDAHYNCYVHKDYFRQNEATVKSRIVKTVEEESDSSQINTVSNKSQES